MFEEEYLKVTTVISDKRIFKKRFILSPIFFSSHRSCTDTETAAYHKWEFFVLLELLDLSLMSSPCWDLITLMGPLDLARTSSPSCEFLTLLGLLGLAGTFRPCWNILTLLGLLGLPGTSCPSWDFLTFLGLLDLPGTSWLSWNFLTIGELLDNWRILHGLHCLYTLQFVKFEFMKFKFVNFEFAKFEFCKLEMYKQRKFTLNWISCTAEQERIEPPYFKCHISDTTWTTYVYQSKYDMNFVGAAASSSSSIITFAR